MFFFENANLDIFTCLVRQRFKRLQIFGNLFHVQSSHFFYLKDNLHNDENAIFCIRLGHLFFNFYPVYTTGQPNSKTSRFLHRVNEPYPTQTCIMEYSPFLGKSITVQLVGPVFGWFGFTSFNTYKSVVTYVLNWSNPIQLNC